MPDYAISVRSIDLNVEVRLNDVATYRHRDGERSRDEDFVNDYMASGRNALTLMVRPAGEDREPPATAEAVAELLSVRRGDRISDGELLAQVSWPEPATPPPPRTYPQTVSRTVNADAPDHRGWRNAAPVTLDEATRNAVLKLLRQLTNALANRDLNATIELLRLKVTERAEAFGSAPADNLAELRSNYQELMNRREWGVEPWEDGDAVMEVVGDGHLVDVTNREGRPLIRSTDLSGIRLVIPTSVGYAERRWVIFR